MRPFPTVAGVLVGLALLAPPAGAQSAGARGWVVDEEGDPIPGAIVQIEHLRRSTTFELQTTDEGEYLQIGLDPGQYRVTARSEGYLGGTVEIEVEMGVTEVPRIRLERLPPPAPPPVDQAALDEMFARAVRLTHDGRLDEAESVYRKILEIQPALPEALGNLGYIDAKREDWESAEAHYLLALDQRPEEPRFLMGLARVYRDSGQDEKAEALVERVAAQEPEGAPAQVDRGIFLVNAGRSEEARQAFEAALATDPSMAVAHYHLGLVLVGQGRIGDALGHLQAYLATEPENEQYAATAQELFEALTR